MSPGALVLAIVSYDAGGAEVLSSYVRRHPGQYTYSLGGPAVGIFRRKGIDGPNMSVEAAVAGADRILCSASWPSDLEYRAIQLARAAGKHVTVFLDHWINYRARLLRSPRSVLPNEIWVGDADAEAIAARELPGVPIKRLANPYLLEFESELEQLGERTTRYDALYVAEIIDECSATLLNQAPYHYTEESALRYFLDNVQNVLPSATSVRIRPHPAEPRDKYDWAAAEYGPLVHISANTTLLEDIAATRVVVGCESMAMVVALTAGRRVICSIPPGGKPCALPHSGIESLQALLT
jgi:hypothetical protein